MIAHERRQLRILVAALVVFAGVLLWAIFNPRVPPTPSKLRILITVPTA